GPATPAAQPTDQGFHPRRRLRRPPPPTLALPPGQAPTPEIRGPDGKVRETARPELGPRVTRSCMFDRRWRGAADCTARPAGDAPPRHRITADVLTATGLVSATGTALLVASGHLHWAILLLIVTGMHDLLDGPVAKAAGTASVRGAFFDSVTDR